MTKFFNTIFDYIKSVVDPSNGGAEAKLFISVTGFFFMLLACCVDLFTGGRLVPTEFMFYTMAGLVTACLGLGTIGQVKAMSVKEAVATELASNDASKETGQASKEIIQSEKP